MMPETKSLSEKLAQEAERPQPVVEDEQYSPYDSFQRYMRSINFPKLLTRDEESYLGTKIQQKSHAIKKLIFSTPYAGQRVVEMMDDNTFGNKHQIGKIKYARNEILYFTNQIKSGYVKQDSELIRKSKIRLYRTLRKINLKVELAEKIAREMKEKLESPQADESESSLLESKIYTQERLRSVEQYSKDYYDAVDQLVTRNLKLVVSIANKYRSTGLDMIDLIEIGNEGLIVAAKEFRSSKGFKFSTFAGNCITNEFNSRLLRRPYDLTILDVPYYTDKVSGESCKDRIIDEATIMPLENIAINEVSEIIKKMLDEKLKDKERKVIQLLFGIYDGVPQTPTEISKMMGVSRQRISIIKEEALAKLKIPAKNAGLEDQFS